MKQKRAGAIERRKDGRRGRRRQQRSSQLLIVSELVFASDLASSPYRKAWGEGRMELPGSHPDLVQILPPSRSFLSPEPPFAHASPRGRTPTTRPEYVFQGCPRVTKLRRRRRRCTRASTPPPAWLRPAGAAAAATTKTTTTTTAVAPATQAPRRATPLQEASEATTTGSPSTLAGTSRSTRCTINSSATSSSSSFGTRTTCRWRTGRFLSPRCVAALPPLRANNTDSSRFLVQASAGGRPRDKVWDLFDGPFFLCRSLPPCPAC